MVAINCVGLVGFLMLMFIDQAQVGARYFAACIVTMSVVSFFYTTFFLIAGFE